MQKMQDNGIIYFAKNNTGYKLAFSNIVLRDAIANFNTSQITEDFILVRAKIVKKPKHVKYNLSKKIKLHRINKDLYDFDSDEKVLELFSKIPGKECIDILDLNPNEYKDSDYYESESDSDYTSDYDSSESDSESENDSYESDSGSTNEYSEYDSFSENDSYNVEEIITFSGDPDNYKSLKFDVKWETGEITIVQFQCLKDCSVFHDYVKNNHELHCLKKIINKYCNCIKPFL